MPPPSKVIFNQWMSSIKKCFPIKDIVHQRLSSIKGRLPSRVVFCQSLSSIKAYLPSKVVLVFIKGCLPSNVIFIKDCHQSKFFLHKGVSSIKLSPYMQNFRLVVYFLLVDFVGVHVVIVVISPKSKVNS